jgi:hypothetical protein
LQNQEDRILTTHIGQAIDRQPARARRLHQRMREGRNSLLPNHDLAHLTDAPGLGSGKSQVRRAPGRLLAGSGRRRRRHAIGRLERLARIVVWLRRRLCPPLIYNVCCIAALFYLHIPPDGRVVLASLVTEVGLEVCVLFIVPTYLQTADCERQRRN